jgi:DNA-binding IclR family transcriptional regulator
LSASRSIEIIELLANFPDRSFTLSDVVKATNINIASSYAILNALTDKGYLLRSMKQKTYQLGPSLIAVGQAAQRSLPIVEQATAAAHDLRNEIGLPVMLNTVVGDELVALVSLPDAKGRHAGMHVGERLPLMAPIGTPFLAWRDQDAVDAWIGRRQTNLDPKLLAALHRDLALTRERGYQIALQPRERRTIGNLMAEMARSSSVSDYKNEVRRVIETFTEEMCQPVEFEPDEVYDVLLIAAPLFDQSGQAVYNLSLGALPPGLKGSVLLAYAERLSQTCLELMRRDRSLARRQG